MKLLILLTALATVALAEPWGYYGYPYHYGYYGYPYLHQQEWPTSATGGTVFGGRGKRSAEPEAEAEAEPWGYYGYPYGYGHQLSWPSYRAPGVSSTVWGARGKRSADPEAHYYGYYGYPAYGYYGYPYGLYRGAGVAGHPGGATSHTFRSTQGIGKRSAEPEPHYPFFGYYGFGYPYYVRPAAVAAPEGTGVAAHPGLATSFVSRSPQGAKAKRSAEPEPYYPFFGYYGYGFPYYVRPAVAPVEPVAHQQEWPTSEDGGTVYGGREKRSAKPFYPYAIYNVPSLQWPGIRTPGFSSTCFGCRPIVPVAPAAAPEAEAAAEE